MVGRAQHGQSRMLFPILVGAITALVIAGGAFGVYNLVQGNGEQPPSNAVLLRAVDDLHQFDGARATYEETVDVQTEPSGWPEWIVGHRVQLVAYGTVDAYVDFSQVGSGQIVANGRAVQLTLPHAQLDKPNLDHKLSQVVAEEPGMADRAKRLFTNDPDTAVSKVYQQAVDLMAAEAARDDKLRTRAETSTRTMLEGMMRSLHFQQVTVTYN
jgi:Protein of unknown function (DUF4230)